MDIGIAVAVSAILISLATMITQTIGLRNKARTTTTDMLTTQLDILRAELVDVRTALTECHRNLRATNAENEGLMRRVLALPDENQVAKVLENAAEHARLTLSEAAKEAAAVLAAAAATRTGNRP